MRVSEPSVDSGRMFYPEHRQGPLSECTHTEVMFVKNQKEAKVARLLQSEGNVEPDEIREGYRTQSDILA